MLFQRYSEFRRSAKIACQGEGKRFSWGYDSRRAIRAELIALVRDGKAETRLTRRANALLLRALGVVASGALYREAIFAPLNFCGNCFMIPSLSASAIIRMWSTISS